MTTTMHARNNFQSVTRLMPETIENGDGGMPLHLW